MKPKMSDNQISKLYYFQLDQLLQLLVSTQQPTDVSGLIDVTGGFNFARITNQLVADGYAEWFGYNNELLNITGRGLLFFGKGGYKQVLKSERINYLKTKTDFIRNLIYMIALFISIVVNILYFVGIITFNLKSIIF